MLKNDKAREMVFIVSTAHSGMLSEEQLKNLYAKADKEIFSNEASAREFMASLGIWDSEGKLTENYR